MRLHEAPCKLITKHSKIGGRGTKSCPLCLTEKITRWKPLETCVIETVLSFNISFIEIKVSLSVDN